MGSAYGLHQSMMENLDIRLPRQPFLAFVVCKVLEIRYLLVVPVTETVYLEVIVKVP